MNSLETNVKAALQYHLEYTPINSVDWPEYNDIAWKGIRGYFRRHVRSLANLSPEAKAIVLESLLDVDTMPDYLAEVD